MNLKQNLQRLPLMVGITGHRDLRPEDIPTLENEIGKVFGDIMQRVSRITPIVLLSPLAEGAYASPQKLDNNLRWKILN